QSRTVAAFRFSRGNRTNWHRDRHSSARSHRTRAEGGAMLSNEGFLTTRDGVRLYFRVRGSGPDLVLIPNGVYLFDDFVPLAPGRTLVFYDVRSRGRSELVDDPATRERGILNDVDDLDDVRRHFGAGTVDVLGHSYVGVTVALYAKTYPERVRRVV